MDLGLLMYDSEAGRPVSPEPLTDVHAPQERPEHAQRAALAGHLLDDRADRDSLPAQRWGVIAPEGEVGDELLQRVEPLIAVRAAQQEIDRTSVKIYRVPATMTPAQAADWRDNVLVASAPTERSLPRYLLILGDFDEVPLELQLALVARFYPGRLAFDRLEDYAAYAFKVLKCEQPGGAPVAPRTLVCTAAVDRATLLAHQYLTQPARTLTEAHYPDDFPVKIEELPFNSLHGVDDLLTAARDPRPTLLWTVSHGDAAFQKAGEGDQAFAARQRLTQGAPVLGKRLSADLVAQGPFLPGGVWFMFACYGAGTPTRSAYWHWLVRQKEQLATEGKRVRSTVDTALKALAVGSGFVAAVPKQALANPEGPLAVIGHVDISFAYSFGLDLIGRQLAAAGGSPVLRYLRVPQYVGDAAAPGRVGMAYGAFCGDLAGILNRLVDSYERDEAARTLAAAQQKAAAAEARGMLAPPLPASSTLPGDAAPLGPADVAARDLQWMLLNDLRSFILLGDPAVRLPRHAAIAGRAA